MHDVSSDNRQDYQFPLPSKFNFFKKALLGEPMVAYILQKERIFIRKLDNFKFGIMNCLTLMVLVACYVTDSLST